MTTLKSGDLAYCDSFRGLIPCRVLSIMGRNVTVKYTASRPGYSRGTLDDWTSSHVVPRGAIRQRGGRFRILPYTVIQDEA